MILSTVDDAGDSLGSVYMGLIYICWARMQLCEKHGERKARLQMRQAREGGGICLWEGQNVWGEGLRDSPPPRAWDKWNSLPHETCQIQEKLKSPSSSLLHAAVTNWSIGCYTRWNSSPKFQLGAKRILGSFSHPDQNWGNGTRKGSRACLATNL